VISVTWLGMTITIRILLRPTIDLDFRLREGSTSRDLVTWLGMTITIRILLSIACHRFEVLDRVKDLSLRVTDLGSA
jgi:hypothetical protein